MAPCSTQKTGSPPQSSRLLLPRIPYACNDPFYRCGRSNSQQLLPQPAHRPHNSCSLMKTSSMRWKRKLHEQGAVRPPRTFSMEPTLSVIDRPHDDATLLTRIPSWVSLPAPLLTSVCHYLSSVLELLLVSRLCRTFRHVIVDSAQVSRSCWSACPLVRVELAAIGGIALSEDHPHPLSDSVEDTKDNPALQMSVQLTRAEQAICAFHSLRYIPALIAKVVSRSATTDELLHLLLHHCRHLRHLALSTAYQQSPPPLLWERLRYLGHLTSLDVSMNVLRAEDRVEFVRSISVSFRQLLHLSVWKDDFTALLQQAIQLPCVISLTVCGDSSQLTPAATEDGVMLFRSFPSLRFVHLPSEWVLPRSEQEGDRKAWNDLIHLHCNIASQLTMDRNPFLPHLRSLSLDIDCRVWGAQRQEEYWSPDQLQRVFVEEEMVAFFQTVPQLEQLTLSSAELVHYGSTRSYDVSFKISLGTLDLLSHLTYLSLDCPKLISKKFLSDLLLPTSALSFRPHLKQLLLVLKVNCMLRVLACFSPRAAFPSLKRCFMRCFMDLDEKDRYKFDLMMRSERQQEYQVLGKLMRDKVGGDVWTKESNVTDCTVDLKWCRQEGLSFPTAESEREE